MLDDGGATLAPGSTDDGGSTLAAFAAARAISKDAARRLIRSGRVDGHLVAGRRGPAWCVHPDDGATLAPPMHEPGATLAPPLHHASDETSTADLVALVRELSGKLTSTAAVAAMWQERARVLGEQLALAAPAESAGASNLTRVWPGAVVGAIVAVLAVLLAAGILVLR